MVLKSNKRFVHTFKFFARPFLVWGLRGCGIDGYTLLLSIFLFVSKGAVDREQGKSRKTRE
jgi:hypothetical protein